MPMLSSLFQLAFYGGDLCRLVVFVSAVQSALHWIISEHPAYLEPNRNRMQKPIGGRSVMALFTTKNRQAKVQPINRGGIDCRERISFSSSTSTREKFMKETAPQHYTTQTQQT